MQRPLEQRLNGIGLIVGPAAVLIVFFVMAGRSGPGERGGPGAPGAPHMGFEAISTLVGSFPLVLAWMLAALGVGWPLRRWLAPAASEKTALQIVLGVAAMLTLDSALGRLGLLQLGGSIGAWLLIAIGLALLIEQVRRHGVAREVDVVAMAPHWMMWAAAPAIGVMLLATTSAPGWLWDTEYGGYDALSYHLQLPKEWMAMGAIAPLEHNVYSFLPSGVEAAFYHLMVLRGDAVSAVYACQLLHAVMGICAAWVVGRVVVRVPLDWAHAKPQAAGAVAFVAVMGTPWVVVAGSMAYNEMAVLLMLAGGLLVIADDGVDVLRRAILVGFLAGVACAAKLTAVGFVVAPLGVLLLTIVPIREWIRALPAGALAGAIALSPYLLSNTVVAGNPVFPFATGMFGTGHWDEEQAVIWREGHKSDVALSGRLIEGWHQLMRFGIGPVPEHEERWHPQWSILPWVTIAAIVMLLLQARSRRWALLLAIVIGMQILFWLAMTHIKSRFMLPMVVPGAGAVAIALVLSSFPHRRESTGRASGAWIYACVGIAALLWSIMPVYVYAKQVGGAPAAAIGIASILTGEALSRREREAIGRADSPAIYINHLLPDGSRVLFVGEAAPFYYDADYTYNTVWDRGPLSRLMHEWPDDAAAWFEALRDEGYTYVLVDAVMLDRWEDAGWNDPLLTTGRIMLAAAQLEVEHEWGRGVVLLRLQ